MVTCVLYVLIVCSITHVRLCPPREEGMERRGTVSTFPKCYVRSCAPLYAVRATRRSRESWDRERERERTGGWRPCKFSLWQSFLSCLPPLLPLFFQKRSVPQLPLFLSLDGETPPFLPPSPNNNCGRCRFFGVSPPLLLELQLAVLSGPGKRRRRKRIK